MDLFSAFTHLVYGVRIMFGSHFEAGSVCLTTYFEILSRSSQGESHTPRKGRGVIHNEAIHSPEGVRRLPLDQPALNGGMWIRTHGGVRSADVRKRNTV